MVRTCFIIVFILVLLGCVSSEEQAKELLVSGNERLNMGELENAEALYLEALQIIPNFPDALNNLGIIRHKQRKFSEALEFFDKAITQNSGLVNAYLNRSSALYELGLYESALRDLNFVETVAGDSLQLSFRKGLIYTQLRDYRQGKIEFTRALNSNPDNPELFTNRGTVYYYLRQLDSAKIDLNKALQIDADFAPALNSLALVYISLDSLERAGQSISRALILEPKDSYFLNNYALLLLENDSLYKAMEVVDESILLDPNNGWAYRNKALIYMRRNEIDRALDLFLEASSKGGNVENLYAYWAQAFYQKGNVKLACEKLREAISRTEDISLISWEEICIN